MLTHNCREFLAEFVSHPKSVGAVAPSSNSLARRVVGCVNWSDVEVVLEYGPGTGVVTEHIVDRLRPETRFIAIELNSRFAKILRERFPGITVSEGCVGNVKALCEAEDVETVDAILSGLPWSSFADQDQTAYLDAMMTVLRPGGLFVTFAYFQGLLLPAGMRFRKKLGRYFSSVRMSKPIWANLPPAFMYKCRR